MPGFVRSWTRAFPRSPVIEPFGFPPAALSLAGFALAHAGSSISDAAESGPLTPLAFVDSGGARRLVRFEADTQEEALANGKAAMASLRESAEAWAFAREGTWRRRGADPDGEDVLVVDFWAAGMPEAATILQPFARPTHGGRFRLLGPPLLVVGERLRHGRASDGAVGATPEGVQAHPQAATRWPTWE